MKNDTVSRRLVIDTLIPLPGIGRKAIDKIRDLPPADQPEIIKCMECRFWAKQENSLQGRCALLQIHPTGEWFCGNARREETE